MNRNKNQQSIDGFSLRRRSPQSGALGKNGLERPAIPQQFLRPHAERATAKTSAAPEILPNPEATKRGGLTRAEIDASLRAVDTKPVKKKKSRRFRKIVNKKLIAGVIVLLMLVGAGYFVSKIVLSAGRVFSGNVLDLLAGGEPLKKDENGRSNILIFGTSEDDPGHSGAALTDSIMLLSIDQEKKTAAMVSVPRDLWVDYGRACLSGYSGKINVMYVCGAEDGDEVAGAAALQSKVGEIYGFDIQYFVKVNYTVVREVTSALGGVTVTIESDDPRGIYDSNMGEILRLSNGPHTIEGEQALAFARARGDGYINYGFPRGAFTRELNQQKLMIAIRDKALSAGTLTNPIAVTGIMDALGNNIRTNFSAKEIKTLMKLGKDIPPTSIVQISLVDESDPMLTTGPHNGQSIVRPVAGIDDFSEVQAYIKQRMNSDGVVEEDATIEVLNASTQYGIAGKKATELTEAGLINVTTNDTEHNSTKVLLWYDLTGGKKPKTAAKLASVLGQQSAGKALPTGVQSEADFVIVLGDE